MVAVHCLMSTTAACY